MNQQTPPQKPAGSRERSLDEVKAEMLRRAGRLSPFEDIRRDDAERVMNALSSLDKDQWALGVERGRARLRTEGRCARRA